MTFASHQLDRTSVLSFFSQPERRQLLAKSLSLAIEEDLAGGFGVDATTESIVPANLLASASIYCKQCPAIIAGLGVLPLVFAHFDTEIVVEPTVEEGSLITSKPSLVATIRGKARAILSGERIALNLLQRMSGIATSTRKFTDLAKPHSIKILDTRKTTPALRVFERYAVAVGGGTNHRFGLSDKILIKDNHLACAGSVEAAVKAVRDKFPKAAVEVECASLDQVKEALSVKAETIMFDNMTPDMVRAAVALVNRQASTEVSGGITLETIKDYFMPGVDAISVGALTHSVSNIDLSLEVESFS
jgi:nicotinate-nucleotide pyrophosphorylase (carboxylating)